MTAVLTVVALAAALACPAHMLWRARRGHASTCLPVRGHAEQIAARQARLASELDRVANHRG